MCSDLHDATLGPAPDGYTLSIVWPVLLGYNVFQNWQLVIVNVEEVVLFIFVVVEVDDAEVVRWTLIVSVSSIVEVVAVCLAVLLVVDVLWLLVEVVVVRRIAPSVLVEMPFKNQEVTFVVL